jgi:hypothetical protein
MACACTSQSESCAASAVDAQDTCTDCGHAKSCCAEKQDLDFSGSFGEEIAIIDLPVVEAPHAVREAARLTKRDISYGYLNKAPPQDLISLHQKLLV